MGTRHWGQAPWNDRQAGWLFGFNGFLKQYFSLTERRGNMDLNIFRNKKLFRNKELFYLAIYLHAFYTASYHFYLIYLFIY